MRSLEDILEELGLPPSDRDQYNLPLCGSHRDRIVAAWIDQQMTFGAVVSDRIKDALYELITGNSSITGRPIDRLPQLAAGDDAERERAKLLEFPT